jgi:hypothetical protein
VYVEPQVFEDMQLRKEQEKAGAAHKGEPADMEADDEAPAGGDASPSPPPQAAAAGSAKPLVAINGDGRTTSGASNGSGGSGGGNGGGGGLSVSFAPGGAGQPERPPGELKTWSEEPSAAGCDYLPDWLSNTLDFVVVFGGDGTVLWTCHRFGNRSVPPLVPFNLGSLGFLTPFEPAAMRRVLGRIVRGERRAGRAVGGLSPPLTKVRRRQQPALTSPQPHLPDNQAASPSSCATASTAPWSAPAPSPPPAPPRAPAAPTRSAVSRPTRRPAPARVPPAAASPRCRSDWRRLPRATAARRASASSPRSALC